ncbi:MAG: ABC transporter ATP-binding protein [Actinomycetota bacterium]|nr:ABC transporter ATP-binding protein [Actinomycetota bacterium]
MTELATHQLTKSYGDRPALEPLTLDIDSGAKVALVGHNGSGKTTLMKMAAGLLDPTEGTIQIGRHPAGSEEARRLLSWLSDMPTFYDDLSLWEHLEFVARLHGVTDWQDTADELLEQIGLSPRRDDIPTTFSRGLRQKAAVTLAFIRPFKLMLVDEPFVGLDEPGKQALLRLFDAAAQRGATLLIATHELTFVKQVGRLLALRDGKLVYDGAPADTDVHALVLPG